MNESTAGRVLVLGDYRQTVTVLRSLGRAGFEVTFGCDDPRSSTALSRYVSALWIYDGSSCERFCHHLEAYLKREKPDFVFAVGETQLRRMLTAASRLAPLATWAAPDPATIARCFDKRALYELTPRLGIPTLPWLPFTGAGAWRQGARAMGFPVVIKSKDSAAQVRGRKALILRSEPELEAFLAALGCGPNPASLVLQKFAPGVRHNCHVAARGGELVAYFQQKVLRTDEPDDTGIGVAGVSVAPSPELRGHCERLTRALGYTGIGCIQFLVDEPGGDVAFLEFNARMDSTAALPYRLGYDFPLLALELAAHREPRALPQRYPIGSTYHWLHGDLNAWLNALRGAAGPGELVPWALNMAWLAATSHHLTFDWRDPLPTLDMFWQRFAAALLRRLQLAARLKSPPLARP